MSQVQQLYVKQPHSRGRQETIWEKSLQRREALLLSELFSRNGRENAVPTATPPGHGYELDDSLLHMPVDAGGPIMQVAAHPGDGPDFFYATYLQMAASTKYQSEFHEILLTDGERGVDGWDCERTRRVRIEEAREGARIVGSVQHFLGYPDGSLSSLAEKRRKQLVAELAEMIGAIQPALLVVHPPKKDHLDHAQSFLLTLAALERNAESGRRRPTLLIHDVEFGLQQENIWLPQRFEDRTHSYEFSSPDYIVDISSTHQMAQYALHKHKTQMYDPVCGQPKAYADLIDKLAEVRGLQCRPERTSQILRGQGFSQIVIPHVTGAYNLFPLRLPAGSLYRRVKKNNM